MSDELVTGQLARDVQELLGRLSVTRETLLAALDLIAARDSRIAHLERRVSDYREQIRMAAGLPRSQSETE